MTSEEQLIEIYRRAYIELVQRIEAKESRGNITDFERALLTDITQILQQLDTHMRNWVSRELPKVYHGSADATYQAFINAGVSPPPLSASFAKIHEDALRAIAENMVSNMTEAHQFVGRKIMDEWRHVALDTVAGKVSTGRTWKDAKRELIRTISDNGLGAFQDSKGRVWRLDSYAEMVIRTTTREATNSGMMNQLEGMGRDLVQMSKHMVTCKICAPYAGRVFSISGKDKRFPALRSVPGFDKGYQTIHGNCRHVLMPYVEELDRDSEGTRNQSNRPFKDERTKAQIAAYDKAQTEKRQRMADRKQWESYRAWLPDDAPKTLAGFRRMKATNSERYQELQSSYRKVRATRGGKAK